MFRMSKVNLYFILKGTIIYNRGIALNVGLIVYNVIQMAASSVKKEVF